MEIQICMGSSCYSRGNSRNRQLAEEFIRERGLRVDVRFTGCLCLSRCGNGPVVKVNGVVYEHVDEGVLLDILTEKFPERGKL